MSGSETLIGLLLSGCHQQREKSLLGAGWWLLVVGAPASGVMLFMVPWCHVACLAFEVRCHPKVGHEFVIREAGACGQSEMALMPQAVGGFTDTDESIGREPRLRSTMVNGTALVDGLTKAPRSSLPGSGLELCPDACIVRRDGC
jgi:hypothetical protein